MISDKKHIVVLSGAGISAESGLKTFRDEDGLWMGHNVYDVATPGAFRRDPAMVLDFYNKRRRDVAAAAPNEAHLGIAALEEKFRVTVITQNIDDLHERAGSSSVLHLHGEIFKMRSTLSEDSVTEIRGDILPGDLAPDGGQYRPHIVWFEEPVPLMEEAAAITATADIFIVIGTSLQVYPAAGLVRFADDEAPKYVIDKKIPPMEGIRNLFTIEKNASEGVKELLALLTP